MTNKKAKFNKFDWSEMNVTPIHGNDYYMVHERVLEFHRRYPDGVIQTEVVEMSNDRFITSSKAFPYPNEFPNMFCQGTACETIGTNKGFKGSELECCETSSVGRALGFLCIGIKHSIASADEVKNAQKNQSGDKVAFASEKQITWIREESVKKGIENINWTPEKTTKELADKLIKTICLSSKPDKKEAEKLFKESNQENK